MKKSAFLLIAIYFFASAQSQPESPWLISGNSGTNPAFHFLGTTDNQPLLFRVNNQFSGKIDSVMALTFFGFGAGKNNIGYYNVGIGYKSLSQNTTGWSNTGIGYHSLYSNTDGGANTASGSYSLYSNTGGSYNTANGWEALAYNTTGTANVAVGYNTLYSNTTGSYNTATGSVSLGSNTTGSYNTATGWSALSRNTTGFQNTANGGLALNTNTTGYDNTAVGYWALRLNLAGYQNTAIGRAALHANSSGIDNTALGWAANGSNTTGSYNTSIGMQTLLSAIGSYYNTAVGFAAGATYNVGWNNTFIGAQSTANANDRYNCVALGHAVINTANNQARIGNSSTTSIGGYVNWTNISDGRYKKNISQNVKGLDFIMKLQPVTYNLDIKGINNKLYKGATIEANEFMKKTIVEKEQVLYSGFIAQDVEKAAQQTGYDFSGIDKPGNEDDLYGLRYAEFVVPLVKAVQEQQEIIKELIKQNTGLQKRVDDLERKSGITSLSSSGSKDILNVWPNPVHDMALLTIVSDNESQVLIRIVDNKGALIKQQRMAVAPGNNQVTADMKGLANGTYHIIAEWSNGQIKETVQVVKQ